MEIMVDISRTDSRIKPSLPNSRKNQMKLLLTASLFMLSLAALRAQSATGNPSVTSPPLGGYFVVYPQAPIITIRFDGNSDDIAKVSAAPHVGTSLNHDGSAFKSFVRSTSSESYQDNVVDFAQRDRNIAEYRKNVKAGKWIPFRNGE
jgi:hypothetical protein